MEYYFSVIVPLLFQCSRNWARIFRENCWTGNFLGNRKLKYLHSIERRVVFGLRNVLKFHLLHHHELKSCTRFKPSIDRTRYFYPCTPLVSIETIRNPFCSCNSHVQIGTNRMMDAFTWNIVPNVAVLIKSCNQLDRYLLGWTQKLAFSIGLHLQQKLYLFRNLQPNFVWSHTRNIHSHVY